MGDPAATPRSRRSPTRSPFLRSALVLGVLTVLASGVVLWLVAGLVGHAGHEGGDEAPIADAVELMKVALAAGVSRWTESI